LRNSGREAGEKWAGTFTNFDRGTADFSFRHMGVLVSRINPEVFGESVQENFVSSTVKT
jgi:hypothetical protein